MGQITLPCREGEVSDGFHTFDELYRHRSLLFIALMHSHRRLSWRAENHSDGTEYEGFFLAGMNLPTGTITYHMKDRYWDLLDGVETYIDAPEWDGHDSVEVIKRIEAWILATADTIFHASMEVPDGKT